MNYFRYLSKATSHRKSHNVYLAKVCYLTFLLHTGCKNKYIE